MKGPQPVPTALKILRGNPGKQKLNRNEPQPRRADGVPAPPEFLDGYARDEWLRIIDELYRLGLVTIVDVAPLAAYCQAYARWRGCEQALAELDGAVDVLSITRLVAAADASARAMLRFATEFGLTPAARARLSQPDGELTPARNKFDGLLAS